MAKKVTATVAKLKERDDEVEQPRQPQEPHLLGLSAELRNRIYQYALVHHGNIIVRETGPMPEDPPLLRTCRQIRNEALGVFYLDNMFYFVAHDLDVARTLKWLSMKRVKVRPGHVLKGGVNWANMVVWFKARWDRKVPGYASPPFPFDGGKYDKKCRTVAGFFKLVSKHKEKGLTWHSMLEILEDARAMVATVESDWEV